MSVLLYEKYLVQGEFHVTLPELLTLVSCHSLNLARLNPVDYSNPVYSWLSLDSTVYTEVEKLSTNNTCKKWTS